MPKFSEIAVELRMLANALDEQPEAVTVSPWISFYCHEKDPFLAIARTLPRPLRKKIEDPTSNWARVKVVCQGFKAIDVNASVDQAKTCEIVEPARPVVYRCEPILSEEEEDRVIS